jgi:hypothetical protein
MPGAERALATGLLALAAIAIDVGSARAWCQMTSCSRRPSPTEPCVIASPPECFPLVWRRPCTSLSLSTMGSRDLDDDTVRTILRRSLDTWENVDCGEGRSPGLSVDVLASTNLCTRAGHNVEGRNVHSVIFVAEGWEDPRMHDPRAFAVTLVWHDPRSGEIWDADMEINEARGPYGRCPDSPEDACPGGLVDLENVTTHELGHYFGVAHTADDPRATMWASAETNETHKRTLEADDVEGLCSIYAQGTLTEDCNPTPRGGLGVDCEPGSACSCRAPGVRSATRTASAWLALVATFAIAVRARMRARGRDRRRPRR